MSKPKSELRIEKSHETVTKTYRGVVKSVTDKGTVIAKISNGSLDRHKEVVDPAAWVNGLAAYHEHPIVLSSHDYHDLRKNIGMALRTWAVTGKGGEEDGLYQEIDYFHGKGNEEADWAYFLAAEKKIAAFSVGFISKKREYPRDNVDEPPADMPYCVHKEVELLENSQVLVPANRECLQQRSFEPTKKPDLDDPIVLNLFDEINTTVTDDDLSKVKSAPAKPKSLEDILACESLDQRKKEMEEFMEKLLAEIKSAIEGFAKTVETKMSDLDTKLETLSTTVKDLKPAPAGKPEGEGEKGEGKPEMTDSVKSALEGILAGLKTATEKLSGPAN